MAGKRVRDPFYVKVGTQIRAIREKRELNQDALADAVKLSRTSICNIEKGRQKLLLHTLCDIARVLSVAPMELLPQNPKNGSSTADSNRMRVVDDDRRAVPNEERKQIEAMIHHHIGGEKK